MHEMAIAESILDIALDYAKQNQAKRIAEVGLKLGEMAGVEEESLRFCFASVVQDTLADGAKLQIEHVPLVGRCLSCGKEQRIEHYAFTCPWCKQGVLEIVSGRELQVAYLEVD